jgi:hypothetical protein
MPHERQQADGWSGPERPHPSVIGRLAEATAYEREEDALTRQLIRTVSVKLLGRAQETVPLSSSYDNFRNLARIPVALADSGRLQQIKLTVAANMADDRSRVHDVAGFARQVIEEFTSELLAIGGAR